MATNNWSDTDPLGSVNANTIDEEFRKLRVDVRERFAQGGRKFAGIPTFINTNENQDGKPCIGIEDEIGDDTGILTLAWDFAGTVSLIRLFGPSHGSTPDQLDFPGNIVIPSASKLLGLGAAAVLRTSHTDAVTAIGYIKQVIFKIPNFTGAISRTLTRVTLVVGTKPVGSSLIYEVRKIVAPAVGVDRYIDGSSSVSDTITLTAGGDFAVENTGLSVAHAVDDEVVVKATSVGSTSPATDATLLLQFE